ncbi:MAG: acetylxylan esterase [Acidobacteriaceae bacterium]
MRSSTASDSARAAIRRASLILAICTLSIAPVALAQTNPDQSRQPVLPPNLPNPLVFADDKPVATPAQWPQRREELLHLFTEQMYGRMPAGPAAMRFHVFDRDPHALGGKATREQITVLFRGEENGPRMDLLLYVPNQVKRPPVILGFNFWGNDTISTDPGIRLSDRWIESGPIADVDLSCVKDNRPTEACRGIDAKRWPVEKILAAGYAVATAYRGDIDPDRRDGYSESIRSAWPELAQGGDNFSTIAAWSWAMSRALDYLETDPLVDAHRAVAFGWSRLGKAAIWAGANDSRFAAVISNESGAGGAKIFHDVHGETVELLNTRFPYWFCANFKQYNGRDAELPFDQNEVLALIAPRPLYIASAILDANADPQGEFLGALAVTPVYRFLGTTGLPATAWPAVNEPLLGRVSYHVRSGIHSVTDFDWDQYLRFCNAYVKGHSVR